MDKLKEIFSWLWQRKKVVMWVSYSTIFFLGILFPLGDLSDLISAQVSKLTQGRTYIQFQDMKMSLFPNAGLALQKLSIETPELPALKTDELIFTPSIWALIKQKPSGTVNLKGFFKGNVEASLSPGKKSDAGIERSRIAIKAKSLSLSELQDILKLPTPLSGTLQLDADSLIDTNYQEQPEAEVTLKIDKFLMPTSNIPTAMGPLTLPELKLSSVEIKGRMAGGRFFIENGQFGKDSDELKGQIKGSLAVSLMPLPGSPTPGGYSLGAYQLEIDLKIKKALQERLNLFLTFIDQFKSPAPDGVNFKFKVSGNDFINPPRMDALR